MGKSFKDSVKKVLKKVGLLKTANRTIMFTKNSIKKTKILFGVKKIDATYTRSFFKKNIEYTDKSAKILIKKLLENYPKTKSVLDLGCGNGLYLDKFIKKGIKDVKGIDGSINAKKEAIIDGKYIEIGDLTKKIKFDRKFDLTICIEVAEHLPSKFAETLVDNVTGKSKTILFTAAPPGQGGTDHVNEQPKEYWIKKFNKRGYKFDEKTTNEIRNHLKKNKCVFWLVENLLIFKK